MKNDDKKEIGKNIYEAICLLRREELNSSERLTLVKLLEAEYWLWQDDPDV